LLKMRLALYIHLPFCLKKCSYCDFFSFPASVSYRRQYLQLLFKEIELKARRLNHPELTSIYLGGGTPSLFSSLELELLLAEIRANFNWPPEIEVTMEINPATADSEKLQRVKGAGINRLSIGAQSFDNYLLFLMGRAHSRQDVILSVQLAKKAGFKNISLDLIYGLPEQSLLLWELTLNEALALKPEHLSLYALEINPLSRWGRKKEKLLLPAEEEVVACYEKGREILASHSYHQYEISNFSLPGFESQHNWNYWQNGNYLGIGMGAVSQLNKKRYKNTCNWVKYKKSVGANYFPPAEKEEIDEETHLAETVFLALRTQQGLNFTDFYHRFGLSFRQKYRAQLQYFKETGLLAEKDGFIRLTPAAFLVSNEIFCEFLPEAK